MHHTFEHGDGRRHSIAFAHYLLQPLRRFKILRARQSVRDDS